MQPDTDPAVAELLILHYNPAKPYGDDSVRDRETPEKVAPRIPPPLVNGTHGEVSSAGSGQGHFGTPQAGGPGRHSGSNRHGNSSVQFMAFHGS